mgnify:CR=1 FL=1
MSVLEIKNIEKSFGGSRVLKDISIQVEDGEIVSIIGPSGSGSPLCCGARPCWRPWIGALCSMKAERQCGTRGTAAFSMRERRK